MSSFFERGIGIIFDELDPSGFTTEIFKNKFGDDITDVTVKSIEIDHTQDDGSILTKEHPFVVVTIDGPGFLTIIEMENEYNLVEDDYHRGIYWSLES